MASFNAHSRAWYQRYRGDGDGSSEVLAQYLEAALRRGDRRAAIYWRRHLAVTAAKHRALAGDSTAERRLAWKDRLGGDAALCARTLSPRPWDRSNHSWRPPCSACAGRLARARTATEYLAEIASSRDGGDMWVVRQGPTSACQEEDAFTPETLSRGGHRQRRQKYHAGCRACWRRARDGAAGERATAAAGRSRPARPHCPRSLLPHSDPREPCLG